MLLKMDDFQGRLGTTGALVKIGPKGETPCLLNSPCEPGEWMAVRLTPNRMLVSAPCWMGACNAGSGYWAVNTQPPFQPTRITDVR